MATPKFNNKGKYILDFNENLQSTSDNLAQEAIKYFSDLFNAYAHINQFSGITCKKDLFDNARENLTKPFQLEEIKEALFQIEDNSSPEPNGMNSKFFKLRWEQLKWIFGRLCLEVKNQVKLSRKLTTLLFA